MTPRVTPIDLSDHPAALRTIGETVAVLLPSGLVLDLWIYEDRATCSIDVRVRPNMGEVNGSAFEPITRVLDIPGAGLPTLVVGVVVR